MGATAWGTELGLVREGSKRIAPTGGCHGACRGYRRTAVRLLDEKDAFRIKKGPFEGLFLCDQGLRPWTSQPFDCRRSDVQRPTAA